MMLRYGSIASSESVEMLSKPIYVRAAIETPVETRGSWKVAGS